MTFTFKDLMSRFLSSLFDSMTRSCCAPSTDKYDLDLQDPEDARLRDDARRTAFNSAFEVHTPGSDSELMLTMLKFPLEHHQQLLSSDANYCDFMLVAGFVRSLEQAISEQQVTPVTELCFDYYHCHTWNSSTSQFIYLISERCSLSSYPSLDDSDDEDESHNNHNQHRLSAHDISGFMDATSPHSGGIYVSELRQPCNKHHANIFELDEPQNLSIFSDDWVVKFAGLASTKNLALPPSVFNQVIRQPHHHQNQSQNHNKHRMREYNVVFRVGGSGKNGWTDSCNAVIVDETPLYAPDSEQWRSSNSSLVGFNWRLPPLPQRTGGNAVAYDETYGLISVGGYKSNACYALATSGDTYMQQNYDWTWRKLADMHETRWFPSCCTMADKVVAMAGSSIDHEPLSSVECYDRERDSWTRLAGCTHARKYGGLSFIGDKLYVGGGDYATQSVEVYDVEKDVWHDLVNTQIPHKYYPQLWKEDDPNLLYITCSYSNSIECLDLRAQGSWKVVCAAKLFQTDSLDLDANQFRAVL